LFGRVLRRLARPRPLIAAQAGSDGVPTRSLVLWVILQLGVLALAVMGAAETTKNTA
jgi:hypothetical protein